MAAAAAAANFLQVFCSVSRVSDVTFESFWVGFSDSFVLQGHGVSPSGRAVWPCFCAVAAAAAAEAAAAANFLQVLCSVSRVSDVTLQSFPCGCVFVPLQWQQTLAAAAAANFSQVFGSVSRVSECR